MAGLLQLKDKFKKGDLVVLIFHDHGSRYVGKIFNDDWMRDRGFLADKPILASDIIRKKKQDEFIGLQKEKTVGDAIELMHSRDLSQIPVMSNGDVVGSVTESMVFNKILADPKIKNSKLESIMAKPFTYVSIDEPLEQLSKKINKQNSALLVKDENNKTHIITEYDVIKAVAR